MNDDMTGPERRKGAYLGTEVDRSWWRRFRKDGFFMRGSGVWWLDAEGLYFLRTLTKEPLFIPFSEMRGLREGTWHAGKWLAGTPVVKLDWERNGQNLCAGFVVSRGAAETQVFRDALEKGMAAAKTG